MSPSIKGDKGLGWMTWLTQVNARQSAVTQNKPKMLTGLSQKATWWEGDLNSSPSWTHNTIGA
jgi:hypothetical protein